MMRYKQSRYKNKAYTTMYNNILTAYAATTATVPSVVIMPEPNPPGWSGMTSPLGFTSRMAFSALERRMNE